MNAPQLHEAAATAVHLKRRELELQLKAFHDAPMFAKALPGRLAASAFFELLDHQADFNQRTIARLAALEDLAGELKAAAHGRIPR